MARIADEDLERLKREVSIERLVEARGVKLKRQGKDHVGRCPFHDDKTPSLVVTPERNLWHCLGACQAGGSVIDWVMKAEGVSFRHAVELLRADAPSLAAVVDTRRSRGRQQGAVPKVTSVRKLAGDFEHAERDEGDEVLLRRVVEHYQASLATSAEALGYLEKRGLCHKEMVERFELGFSNRTLGYRLPMRTRKTGAAIRDRLERLGIYRESGHEHMSGSIVVPLFDAEGRIAQMYGRKVCERLREGTPLHLYLPGPQRGLFNREAFASKEVILCESIFDALTFWCAGYRHVTSCYGVSGFTAELREALRRSGTERVLVAFDRDEAGDRGAAEVGAELGARGIEVRRVLFPLGMDANEYAQKVGPAEESLGAALRGAVWLAGKRPAAVAVAASAAPSPAAEEGKPTPSEPPLLAARAAPPPGPAPVGEPPAPPPGPARAERNAQGEVELVLGDRRWRVRGLDKNTSRAELRVQLAVRRESTGGFHVDTVELYSARQRVLFVKMAAEELGLAEDAMKSELGTVLAELERLQDEAAAKAVAPGPSAPAMSEAEREAALALLRDPDLVERILGDFDRLGVVGERTNKLLLYLAAASRKLDEPLAVVIQSSSAAGKSSLMESVLSLVPEEERVQYSAMTGQSLFYMAESCLKHKVLAIVEEEGAERASYALKLLQSEGVLTIASTGKDPQTGRLVTEEYRVEGPVMIMLTTTAIDVDEELLNRCLVLAVDEGRAQTRAIHARQRRAQTLAGVLERRERDHIVKLHRNAQRLLEPLVVVNPFAEELGFVDHLPRTRRDHMKYLTLIRTVALLHQHQREVKELEHRGERVRYIEVSRADIELASRLGDEVLGRSLDELAPQTRKVLERIEAMVRAAAAAAGVADVRHYPFSRRQVREHTGMSHSQLRVHLGRLVEMEYVFVHRGAEGKGHLYDLVWDGRGKDGRPFVSGLLSPGELGATSPTTPTLPVADGGVAAQKGPLAGGWRGENGPKTGGCRSRETSENDGKSRAKSTTLPVGAENAPRDNGASERVVVVPMAAAAAASRS